MSSAFRRDEPWGQPAGPVKTSSNASLALASGILSFVCLFGFGGALAVALGWMAHGEIERSQGRVSGKGLANAGIGLGIVNLVASVVGLGVLVALAVRPDVPTATRGGPPPSHLTPPISPPALPAPMAPPSFVPELETEGETEAELLPLPLLPAQIGKIAIIEAKESAALEQQLLAQLSESAKSGERVVLWTVTSPCEPCAAVGRALPDARMQRALSGVRLVRADAHAFARDLQKLGVPTEFVPGFTLLDGRAYPIDHIYGGEWDDDIPANIAPILDKFVKRKLLARRHQWSRPLREGETPL
jgi:Domain of unknown function (DUF4190)